MSDSGQPSIIVIKRIIKKGGHHGGSWKIAYADFVTAMMAFFMLMWMLSMLNKYQLQGISNYFKKPMRDLFIENQQHNTTVPKAPSDHTQKDELAPKIMTKDGHSLIKNTQIKDKIAEKPIEPKKPRLHPKEAGELAALKKSLEDAMMIHPEIKQYQQQLSFEIVDDGLKIQLRSLQNRPMFTEGQADFERYASDIIKWLSVELNKTPRKVTIIGHTDTEAYGGLAKYSNWELSSDRANAARQILLQNGMDEGKIIRVQGAGSSNLLFKKDGANPANRRIDVIVLTDKATARMLKQ